MKRNRLYTVNEWNKPLFRRNNSFYDNNLFYGGGSVLGLNAAKEYLAYMMDHQGIKDLGTNNFVSDPNKSSTPLNPSETQTSASTNFFGKVNNLLGSDIGKMGIGAVGSIAGNAARKALSGGLDSGVGNGIADIGGTVGSVIGNVNPVLGAAISLGSGVIGGAVNGLFGTGVNEAELAKANEAINYYGGFNSNAEDFDSIKGPVGMAGFEDPYKTGLLRSKSGKNDELRRSLEEKMGFAYRSIDNNVHNLAGDQLNDSLFNYHALGGDLDAKFFDDFGKDPIGAAVRYNQGLEQMAAEKEMRMAEAAREAEYNEMQKRVANLETQNQGLQALMAAQPATLSPSIAAPTVTPEVVESRETPIANDDYSNLMGFIRAHEGFRNKAYLLPGESAPTIGYGFHITNPVTGKRIQMGDRMTREEAEQGLRTVITNIGNELSRKVPNWNNLKPHQQHALIDLAYGTGTNGKHFRSNSRLMTALRNGDMERAERELVSRSASLPDYNDYLLRISKRRQDMFRNGNYSMRAFGGELGTNGTNFTNGLLQVNEGGTHESNPLEGVPMGVDENGTPNLVEEGETVYNDYVFSDRMKVPGEMYRELGLGGALKKSKDSMSFADASKKLARESEVRPNDPISKAGLDASLAKLAEVQEAERAKHRMKEYVGLEGYACGGKMARKYPGGGYLWDRFWEPTNPTSKRKGNTADTYMIDTNYKGDVRKRENEADYQAFTNYMLNDASDAERLKYFTWIDNNIGSNRRYTNKEGTQLLDGWQDRYRTARTDGKWGIQHYTPLRGFVPGTSTLEEDARILGETSYGPPKPTVEDIMYGGNPEQQVIPNPDNNEEVPYYPTWMRYAPVVGAGLMAVTDALGLTNTPDYTSADRLEAAASRAGYAPDVRFQPNGDYMRYTPFDRNYWSNQLLAGARATDRAIMNTASPSRMAGLVANGYNTTLGLGNVGRQGDEYNRAQYERVKEFNRKTNMFNSQLGLEAAIANARYRQQASQMGLSGLAQALALRDSIDQRVGNARSLNIKNLLDNLGAIGRENFAMNQINSTRAAHNNYYGDLSGRVHHENQGAFGGRIRKRK